jgi:hypothetical protein
MPRRRGLTLAVDIHRIAAPRLSELSAKATRGTICPARCGRLRRTAVANAPRDELTVDSSGRRSRRTAGRGLGTPGDLGVGEGLGPLPLACLAPGHDAVSVNDVMSFVKLNRPKCES